MANIVNNVNNCDNSDNSNVPLFCHTGAPVEQGDVTPRTGATVGESHKKENDGDDIPPVCLHVLYGDAGVRDEMRRTRFTYLPVTCRHIQEGAGVGVETAGVDTDVTPPSPSGEAGSDTDNGNNSRRRRVGKQEKQRHHDYSHEHQHSLCPRCDPVTCDCSCSAPCVAPCVVCTLRRYRYDGEDESAISVLMTPFWDWCTQTLVPRWMAANVLTLVGFVCILSTFLLQVLVHSPALHTQSYAPQSSMEWVYIYTATMLFVYQTLDAVDGKHARSTGTMSAVGELLDHGCDSLVVVLQSAILCSTLQLGHVQDGSVVLWTLAVFASVYTNAYLVVWEDFLTGTMRLSAVGPTEAIVAVMVFLVHAGIFGVKHYTVTVASMKAAPSDNSGTAEIAWQWLLQWFPEQWTMVQACLLMAMVAMTLGSCATVHTVVNKAIATVSGTETRKAAVEEQQEKTRLPVQQQQRRSKVQSLASLMPYLSGVALFFLWAWCVPIGMFSVDKIATSGVGLISNGNSYTLLAFLCCFGLHSSYCQVRCIFARVTGQRIPAPVYRITLPLPLIVAYSVMSYVLSWPNSIHSVHVQTVLLYGYLAFVILVYGHFVVYGLHECLVVLNMRLLSQRKRHGRGTLAMTPSAIQDGSDNRQEQDKKTRLEPGN